MRSHVLQGIALILVIIGALNWGLVGLFSFDLVAAIFGAGTIPARVVYVVVAIAGLILIPELARYFRNTTANTDNTVRRGAPRTTSDGY